MYLTGVNRVPEQQHSSDHATEERSNCLDCQGSLVCYALGTSWTCHGFWCLTMALKMVQEFAHAGRQRNLLGFARGAQALVKGFEHRIIADGHEGTHVQGSPHMRTPTPGRAGPPAGCHCLD